MAYQPGISREVADDFAKARAFACIAPHLPPHEAEEGARKLLTKLTESKATEATSAGGPTARTEEQSRAIADAERVREAESAREGPYINLAYYLAARGIEGATLARMIVPFQEAVRDAYIDMFGKQPDRYQELIAGVLVTFDFYKKTVHKTLVDGVFEAKGERMRSVYAVPFAA